MSADFEVLPPAPPHIHRPNLAPEVKAHPCDNCASVESKVDEILTRLQRLEPLIEYAEHMMAKRNTFLRVFAP